MPSYLSGDGLSGEVVLDTSAGGVLYAAGAGDKVITAGDGSVSINTGSGADIVHLGAGAGVVTFGSGASTAYSGSGNDAFVMHPGAAGDVISGFKGASLASGEGPKDFLHLSGYSEGSQLVLESGVGAADQSYAVVDANGVVESRFQVVMAAGSDGVFHSLTAGRDYVLDDATPAPRVTDPTPPTGPSTPPTTDPGPPVVTDPTPPGGTDPTPPSPPSTPAPVTLDFDAADVGQRGGVYDGFKLSDDGFVIGSGVAPGLGNLATPGFVLNLASGHDTTLLERADGQAFVLDGLDIDTSARVVLTGHLVGGGTESATVAGGGHVTLDWGPVESVSLTNIAPAATISSFGNAMGNASLLAAARLVEVDNIQAHLFF